WSGAYIPSLSLPSHSLVFCHYVLFTEVSTPSGSCTFNQDSRLLLSSHCLFWLLYHLGNLDYVRVCCVRFGMWELLSIQSLILKGGGGGGWELGAGRDLGLLS